MPTSRCAPSTRRFATLALILALAAAAVAAPRAQDYRRHGVSPIFDGWEELANGTRLFYFGYINRSTEPVTVPVGADNGFSGSAADRGQPENFLPGRHEHVFTVPVPTGFTGTLVWTVKSEIGPQLANASLNQLYILEQRENMDANARPPAIAVGDLSAAVGEPVRIAPRVTAAQASGQVEVEGARAEGAGLNLQWSKYRGPGRVAFTAVPGAPPRGRSGRGRGAEPVPGVFPVACDAKPADGCGAVMASFDTPGVYRLRVEARQDGLEARTFVNVTVK